MIKLPFLADDKMFGAEQELADIDGGILKILELSLVAVLIVFTVLLLIIFVSGGFSKSLAIVDKKTKILPKEENKLLAEDEDAVAAALVATIEFHKETKTNARLKSIKRID